MDITRTIQQDEDPSHIDGFFQGQNRELRFPVKGKPKRLGMGDYVYLIFRGKIVGRFSVTHIVPIPPNQIPYEVGKKRPFTTKGTYFVVTKAPGERTTKLIHRRGHQGIRYDNVSAW